jgi:hypothetical protein
VRAFGYGRTGCDVKGSGVGWKGCAASRARGKGELTVAVEDVEAVDDHCAGWSMVGENRRA